MFWVLLILTKLAFSYYIEVLFLSFFLLFLIFNFFDIALVSVNC